MDRYEGLERRVRAVEDYQAIQNLLALSCHRIDGDKLHRMVLDIFVDDAVLNYGKLRVTGREQINALLTGFESAFLGTSHNLTNVYIKVDGDDARALSYVLAWHWSKQDGKEPPALLPSDILVVAGYQDRLKRTPAGWRIAERITLQFGTGIGVGAPSADYRPIIEGMSGQLPNWPE